MARSCAKSVPLVRIRSRWGNKPASLDSGDDISLMEETEEAEAPAPEPDKSEQHEDGDGGKDFYQGNDFAGQESDRSGPSFFFPHGKKLTMWGVKILPPIMKK